jgi:hypothetical protein
MGARKLKGKRFLKIPSIGKVTVTSFISSNSSYGIMAAEADLDEFRAGIHNDC